MGHTRSSRPRARLQPWRTAEVHERPAASQAIPQQRREHDSPRSTYAPWRFGRRQVQLLQRGAPHAAPHRQTTTRGCDCRRRSSEGRSRRSADSGNAGTALRISQLRTESEGPPTNRKRPQRQLWRRQRPQHRPSAWGRHARGRICGGSYRILCARAPAARAVPGVPWLGRLRRARPAAGHMPPVRRVRSLRRAWPAARHLPPVRRIPDLRARAGAVAVQVPSPLCSTPRCSPQFVERQLPPPFVQGRAKSVPAGFWVLAH
jgi:hypothetical protein